MNCKNCEYGLEQRCRDFEKILCTYEEGECVKITELEKQIEKMKTRIKEIIFSNDFVNNSPHQNLEKKVRALCDFYKEIKENTELKSGCGICYRKDKENLAKAKEIMKKLLIAIHIWDYKNLEKAEAEAEQFLQEEINGVQ